MEVDIVLVHPTFLHSTRGKVPGKLVHEHEAVVVVEITNVGSSRRSYPLSQDREVNWAQGFPAFLGGFVYLV